MKREFHDSSRRCILLNSFVNTRFNVWKIDAIGHTSEIPTFTAFSLSTSNQFLDLLDYQLTIPVIQMSATKEWKKEKMSVAVRTRFNAATFFANSFEVLFKNPSTCRLILS